MRRRGWFWAAVALQVLLLVGMVGMHGYTLATGRPVMLKTAPVDPWDPLRGQYVTLGYEISQLDQGKLTMTGTPYRSGQSVWVILQPDGQYWKAVSVSDARPQAAAEQVAVRGTVAVYSEAFGDRPAQLWVRYGIEQFYVPEGEGKGLESGRADMAVEAVVDSFGRAALHRLFLDGKEIRWR